jgi:hypothetical protein
MKPEQISALATWLAEQVSRLDYGSIEVVLKIHNRKVVRLEKDVRILELPEPEKVSGYEYRR